MGSLIKFYFQIFILFSSYTDRITFRMAFIDIFIGSAQSKYAAMAIFVAIAVVCLTVLFSKEKIPIGQKLLMAVLLFLLSLPTILYALFQMTCLVTGSSSKTWWCGAFAWFLTALVVLYAFLVIIMAVLSLNAERDMAAVESFYAKQALYDHFAASEMEGEEEKKEVTDALPGGGTVANQDAEVENFYKVQTEVPAPVVPEAEMVAPVMEQFTSCGAPVPQKPNASMM